MLSNHSRDSHSKIQQTEASREAIVLEEALGYAVDQRTWLMRTATQSQSLTALDQWIQVTSEWARPQLTKSSINRSTTIRARTLKWVARITWTLVEAQITTSITIWVALTNTIQRHSGLYPALSASDQRQSSIAVRRKSHWMPLQRYSARSAQTWQSSRARQSAQNWITQ